MLSAQFIIFIVLSVGYAMAVNVADIAECPALPARQTPARDVTDLRIDDIKIIAGLGDR